MVGLWDEKSGIKKEDRSESIEMLMQPGIKNGKEMFDYKKTRNNEHGKLIELIKEYE